VIEPGARAAAEATRSGIVGVIGTRGTIASRAYEEALGRIDASLRVIPAPCPLLVPLAEEGWIDRDVTRSVIREYVEPLLEQSIDTLILGCTHFPVLKKTIGEVVGPSVTLVDNATATAHALRETIEPSGVAGRVEHRFVVSDVPHRFREEAELFLGGTIGDVERISPELLEEIYGES
jgi:glutamate racemase